jgi:DnaJ family protein C protein 2
VEKQLAELDSLCEILEPEEVKDLKEKVEAAGKGGPAKEAIREKVKASEERGEGMFAEFA